MLDKYKDRQTSEVSFSCSNKNENNELYGVTLASVDGQKLKAQKVFLSASSISFKKLLVDNLNCHTLILIRKKWDWKSLDTFIDIKRKKKNMWSPLWYISL